MCLLPLSYFIVSVDYIDAVVVVVVVVVCCRGGDGVCVALGVELYVVDVVVL